MGRSGTVCCPVALGRLQDEEALVTTLAIQHSPGREPRVGKWLRLQLGNAALALAPASPMQLAGRGPGSRAVASDAERSFLVRASGDLTDCRVLRRFQARCEALLHARIDHVVLDLSEVEQADTKLVACLLVVLRRARSVGVRLEVCCSHTVNEWLAFCRLTQLLQPSSGPSDNR